MKNMTVDMNDLKYIDDDVYGEISRYIIEKDDLYLTIAGTIGKVGEIPEELHGMNLTENAARLTDIACDKLYLMYALQTDVVQSHFSMRFHQVAQPKLSIETASSTLIALPPLFEQKRSLQERTAFQYETIPPICKRVCMSLPDRSISLPDFLYQNQPSGAGNSMQKYYAVPYSILFCIQYDILKTADSNPILYQSVLSGIKQ